MALALYCDIQSETDTLEETRNTDVPDSSDIGENASRGIHGGVNICESEPRRGESRSKELYIVFPSMTPVCSAGISIESFR
jgi:hypothetical protein